MCKSAHSLFFCRSTLDDDCLSLVMDSISISKRPGEVCWTEALILSGIISCAVLPWVFCSIMNCWCSCFRSCGCLGSRKIALVYIFNLHSFGSSLTVVMFNKPYLIFYLLIYEQLNSMFVFPALHFHAS